MSAGMNTLVTLVTRMRHDSATECRVPAGSGGVPCAKHQGTCLAVQLFAHGSDTSESGSETP